MIEIDGPLWFLGAIVICGAHVLYLRGWRREHRQSLAWWQKYDADAQKRHAEFMRAIDGDRTVDDIWSFYKSERGQA